MSEGAARKMSQDEFLDWCQFQDIKYELVDGAPVAMVGTRRAHDRVVINTIGSLGNQLQDNPCRPFTDNTAVRIPNGNTRRPDGGIDCGQFDPDALAVDLPRFVLEVLSPTTRTLDMFDKLDEYKTVPGLAHIILIDPDTPQAIHWWREADQTWRHTRHEGLGVGNRHCGSRCDARLADAVCRPGLPTAPTPVARRRRDQRSGG